MLQNDYIMQMIINLVAAIRRSMQDQQAEPDNTIEHLEVAVGQAVDMEPSLFFSLAPESMVQMMQLGSTDAVLSSYVVRSILLEAQILERSGQTQRADLRRAQADAIADAYDCPVTEDDMDPEALEEYFLQLEEEEGNPSA